MDPVKFARNVVGKRYGLLFLPDIRSRSFLNLIRGTKHLVDIVTSIHSPSRNAKSFSISYDESASASTDMEFNVRIPSWYCYTESLEKFVGRELTAKEAAAVSISIINGSSIHEALHVSYSGGVLTRAFQGYIQGRENPALYNHLIQIVEDLKNESVLYDGHHSILDYVIAKNEIFFSDEKIKEYLDRAEKEYGDDRKSIALEILVGFKCESRRDFISQTLEDLGLTRVAELLFSACNIKALVKPIVDELYAIFLDSKSAKKSGSDATTHYDQQSIQEAQQVMKRILERDPDAVIEIKSEQLSGDFPSLEEHDILSKGGWLTGSSTYSRFDVSLKFGFIRKLKVARQIVPSLKEPRATGAVLMKTRLSRIATDGKMFSNRGEAIATMQKKQPEFIILGDFSGSMGYLIAMVNETLRKISQEMVDAGIPHAVYGHTSMGENDIPLVLHIFSYKTNETTSSSHEQRFDAVKRVALRENYDGYAITHVSKKFNRACQNKVLIVLSDGAPCAPFYMHGNQHTEDAIKAARKNGIKVISLSLTEGVMDHNNDIYGYKFNVDATSQQKLEIGLQRIILGG